MKHIKKVILLLCMMAFLFGMTACSQNADDGVDATLAASLEQVGTQFLDMFNNFSETDIISYKEQTEQQKDTVMYAALESWEGVQEDLGAFVAIQSVDVSKTDDGYMIDVNTTYEKRDMTFSMGVDANVTEYTSMSFNPVYTIGEKLEKAALNTLLGMGTVFIVLIFISLLISCFKYIHEWEERLKKASVAQEQPVAAPAPTVTEMVEEEEEDVMDDTELIAVITAAIAAASASDNTASNGLVVRSVKRVPTSKWKRA